jgi:hypothetical protein
MSEALYLWLPSSIVRAFSIATWTILSARHLFLAELVGE